MPEKKYKVWTCFIAVPIDAVLPEGFDNPPRRAAVSAVERQGIPVLHCFSGWGGELSAERLEVAEELERKESQ